MSDKIETERTAEHAVSDETAKLWAKEAAEVLLAMMTQCDSIAVLAYTVPGDTSAIVCKSNLDESDPRLVAVFRFLHDQASWNGAIQ